MRLLLAVLAATTACALGATTASAATSMALGFSDQSVNGGQLSAADSAALASRAGVTSSRVTFDWRWAQPDPGTWRLAPYDAIYAADLAKGIRPVFVLLFAPQWTWASGVTCNQWARDCRYPPGADHLDDWGAMVAKLVARYPLLGGIEVWNEPNLRIFWGSAFDPARYVAMVRATRDAVRRAGSGIPVLAGALSAANDQDQAAHPRTTMSYRTFLRGMYAAGAKGLMDAISLHPYPDDLDLWRFYKMLTEVRDIRDANGDDTPLFVSELGVTDTGTDDGSLDDRHQALTLARMLGALRAMPDVTGTEIHTLVDVARAAQTSSDRGFGMLRLDLSPKPAYCAIAEFQGAAFSCALAAADGLQDERWDAQPLVQAAVDAARAYRAAHGSWTGLTAARLHAIDPRISATAQSGTAVPGGQADPSRIYVKPWGANVLVCAASQADRSYCAVSGDGRPWTYGMSTRSIFGTASLVLHRQVWWW